MDPYWQFCGQLGKRLNWINRQTIENHINCLPSRAVRLSPCLARLATSWSERISSFSSLLSWRMIRGGGPKSSNGLILAFVARCRCKPSLRRSRKNERMQSILHVETSKTSEGDIVWRVAGHVPSYFRRHKTSNCMQLYLHAPQQIAKLRSLDFKGFLWLWFLDGKANRVNKPWTLNGLEIILRRLS